MISLRSMILSVTGCELFEKNPPGGIISLQAENTIQSEVVKMIIKIENDALLAELSTQGAYIEKLYDKRTGKDHIWQYDAQYWPRRTSICFPIMSILKNDETVIEGKTYHMENHGFLREMELDVISSGADCVTMRAQANEMTKKHYPYDFCFDAIETGSIIAIGMIGCKRTKPEFLEGYKEMLERIKPSAIICLGKPFEEMQGNLIEVDYLASRKVVRNGR